MRPRLNFNVLAAAFLNNLRYDHRISIVPGLRGTEIEAARIVREIAALMKSAAVDEANRIKQDLKVIIRSK